MIPGCYDDYNTYTDGDMNNIIKTVSLSHDYDCAHECDRTPGCKMITWRDLEQNCYIHSTNNWEWGFTYRSVIYFIKC